MIDLQDFLRNRDTEKMSAEINEFEVFVMKLMEDLIKVAKLSVAIAVTKQVHKKQKEDTLHANQDAQEVHF